MGLLMRCNEEIVIKDRCSWNYGITQTEDQRAEKRIELCELFGVDKLVSGAEINV